MFLDDVIRLVLPQLFPVCTITGAYSIKLSRDAELYLDDEFSEDVLEKIRKALAKRKTGVPTRFLYDLEMPRRLLGFLLRTFRLRQDDLVRGGRYHNFNDLIQFPDPLEPELINTPLVPLAHPELKQSTSLLGQLEQRDLLLFFPYHSYEPVIRMLNEAADDPSVTSISITLYRVAKDSRIVQELLRAAQNGKSVTAVVEVKARFDEESNIRWVEELEQAGVRVQYRFPGLKVHAKMCLITRETGSGPRQYVYLSTGNFNEKTAELYSDFGYFTADRDITEEVASVFAILSRGDVRPVFNHLLVAPFTMRKQFVKLIRREIKNARKGKPASIIIKINSLEDTEMIDQLYKASEAGVTIKVIVRGVCCLVPGIPGISQTIEAISIIDRFLEHGRVFIFHNGGEEECYLSSADWMTRNLSRRIEVAFPVKDPGLLSLVKSIILTQLNDSFKARVINARQNNHYRSVASSKPVRSQLAIYRHLRDQTAHEGEGVGSEHESTPEVHSEPLT